MSRPVLTTALLACLLASAHIPRALAGAEGAADRFRDLVGKRNALLRQNALLKREAEIAVTKEPYILFDPAARTLAFRVRGRTMKTYQFTDISLDARLSRKASPEELYRAIEGALTVRMKEGGHPELIPPDPDTGREAGLLYSDPNQLASQTGVVPLPTDAGILGVDVPSEYHISFEEGVVLHIRNPRTLTFRQKATDRLGQIASAMRDSFSGWWGSAPQDIPRKPRLSLWLTTDVETAKNLHYSLLPGEKIFLVPPPPPEVVLVAMK